VASRPKRPCTSRNRACYRCVATKRRCDSEQPCRCCAKQGLPCTYPPIDTHSRRNSQQEGSSWICKQQSQSAISPPLSTCLVLPVFELDAEPAQSFPFLLEFTRDLSLPYSFENDIAMRNKATVPERPLWELQPEINFDHELPFDLDGWLWNIQNGIGLPAFTPVPFCDNIPIEESNCHDASTSNINSESWEDDLLSPKSLEIALAVERHSKSSRHHVELLLEERTSMDSGCLDFFSPPRLRRYLDLYWEMWYPNWPTIHKPLFDPQQASSLLVAAMAIIGACHSPDPAERAASNTWADAVERWASAELDDINLALPDNDRRHSVGTIQAAGIICIYQNWNGSIESKRRMRRQFFGVIVGVSPLLSEALTESKTLVLTDGAGVS
jgi:hypothetical protein